MKNLFLLFDVGGDLPVPKSYEEIMESYMPGGKSILPPICYEKFWLPITRSKKDIFTVSESNDYLMNRHVSTSHFLPTVASQKDWRASLMVKLETRQE